jgi:hypothetical protein
MRAVLENALACFQRQFVTEGHRVQREAREAEEWFLSDDSHWLFSFVSICEVLGLEPESVRQGLQRWRHSPPNTPQRKRRLRGYVSYRGLPPDHKTVGHAPATKKAG